MFKKLASYYGVNFFCPTDECINFLYVLAYTSGLNHAGADKDHKIQLQVNGLAKTKILPDLPANDYFPSKGDLWKLSLRSFFGFHSCVKIGDIESINIIAGSNDGWNIDSIVTFAVYDKSYWEVTSEDFNVNRWVDTDHVSQRVFPLSLTKPTGRCVQSLYVMAHTSNVPSAGADKIHKIELQEKGLTVAKELPNLPGDDYFPSKGDLWKLNLNTFFGVKGCISRKDITGIALLAGNNDGWNIDSVITYVVFNNNQYQVSSVNLDANRWVDGDSAPSYKRFQLTLVP